MRRIREIESLKDVAIIALTGLAMEDDARRCLLAGADRYVSKPFKMRELTEIMEQVVAERAVETRANKR